MCALMFAHLTALVEVGAGGTASGRWYFEKHFMAVDRMGYSSICLIFKLKVGRWRGRLWLEDDRLSMTEKTTPLLIQV